MGKKDRTREQILEVATELFLSHGLLDVGMERIAQAADTSRRNLYRHFPTRESLAYEVTTQLLRGWNREQAEIYAGLQGSGKERLGAFLAALVGTLDRQRPMLRFLGEFDVVFQDSLAYRPAPEAESEFNETLHLSEELIGDLLRRGMEDGSLPPGLDLAILVPTITTTLWTLAQRVALRSRMIAEEFGVDGLDMVREQLRLLLRALEP